MNANNKKSNNDRRIIMGIMLCVLGVGMPLTILGSGEEPSDAVKTICGSIALLGGYLTATAIKNNKGR